MRRPVMVALQRDQYNPTSRILKYRAKHDKSFYLDKPSKVDPDVTDISYDSDSKINAYTQNQKRLSDDEIRQIVEKYSAGASTYELAAEFGCHRSTISRALKKSGINVTTVRKILHENGVHIRSSSEYKGHTR